MQTSLLQLNIRRVRVVHNNKDIGDKSCLCRMLFECPVVHQALTGGSTGQDDTI